jgi:hypothetical protein
MKHGCVTGTAHSDVPRFMPEWVGYLEGQILCQRWLSGLGSQLLIFSPGENFDRTSSSLLQGSIHVTFAAAPFSQRTSKEETRFARNSE